MKNLKIDFKKLFFAFIFFAAVDSQAQKTAVFNGKTYLVYPQKVDVGYSNSYPSLLISEKDVSLQNVHFPPIIGSVPDGEYLIYSKDYEYITREKGKKKIFDTVQVVYGTFKISNNEKNGLAILYNKYNSKQIELKLNYKNDLLEGSFIVNVSVGYSDEINQYKDYSGKKYPMETKSYNVSQFALLNIEKGLINGEILINCVLDNDTFLTTKLNVSNNVLNGSFIKNKYTKLSKKSKPQIEIIKTGYYIHGKKDGDWKERRFYKNWGVILIQEIVFKKGEILEIVSYGFDKLNRTSYKDFRTTFSKDSVLFYFPNYKKEKTMLYTDEGYYFNYSYDSFILVTTNTRERYFKVYDLVSENFYKNYNQFDTFINGIKIRVRNSSPRISNKLEKSKSYSIVDSLTFSKDYDHKKIQLYTEDFDIKTNKYLRTIYFDAYKKYFFKDSLVPELKSKIVTKNFTESTYFYKASDYTFANIKYTKGKLKNCESYCQVKGGKNNGSIINYIKIPSYYDTLYLIDTIMANGKYLYVNDNYFNIVYTQLKSENGIKKNHDYTKYSYFSDEIDRYFELLPKAHKLILLGSSPYNGKVNLNINYTLKPELLKAIIYEDVCLNNGISKKNLSIDIEFDRNIECLGVKKNKEFIMPIKQKQFCLIDGKLYKNIKFIGINNKMALFSNVHNNLLDFETLIYTYKIKKEFVEKHNSKYQDYDKNYYQIRITDNNTYAINYSTINFKYGNKEGQWLIYKNDKLFLAYNFKNDKQNGQQIIFENSNSNYIKYFYNMNNGIVNGNVVEMYENGSPKKTGCFKNGIPHGDFTAYFRDLDTGMYFYCKVRLNNGYYIGDYIEYKYSNILKKKIIFNYKDSNYFLKSIEVLDLGDYYDDERFYNDNIIQYNSGIPFLNSIFETASFKKAYYQYYYTSGYLFKQGFKKYNQPIGEWKVYREGNNRIYKTIDFKDSLLFAGTPDSLHTYGLVKAYYDNGKLMFTGYATDFEFKYSCESDADMPTENDHYLNFYDTLGKPMITNGSGFITELQANGNKLKEGKIVNNKKEGIWIYYSKFGLPDAIGGYKNGLKTGRWLAGDLGGLNLDEQICFMSDEEFKGWVKAFGSNLNLREEYYDNGELLNSNYVNTIKQ